MGVTEALPQGARRASGRLGFRRRGAMDPGAREAIPRSQDLALRSSPEALPPVSYEEDMYECLDYYYLRDFPSSGAGRSKGRTRREQALRTNRPVVGGHERKIAQKLFSGQRKRRQLQLQPRPRTRLA
ncbi:nuclear protein 2 [Ctenodactylus gundi]